MDPLVSVVVPTYNRAAFVAEAVASLLGQGTIVPDIVVVDDGSTDDTASALATFGDAIRIVHQANAGPGAARNAGIRLVTGELVAFLDSDNLCCPGSLDHRAELLAASPEIDLVVGRTQVAVGRAGPDGDLHFESRGEPVPKRSISATMVRGTVLERVGLFDERLRFGEDDDWFMRAAELGVSIVYDDAVSQVRRLHDGNLTLATDERTQALLGLLKNRLDRGRAGDGHDLSRSATDGDPSPP